MTPDLSNQLRAAGIQPSAQRLAVAGYVLVTDEHPSAERVFERAREALPMLSRATVYNTLNLFVRKGLLRQLALAEGHVVYDPRLSPHHHFVDDLTGLIEDVPWELVKVGDVSGLRGYEVREWMVVMRGRRLGGPRSAGRKPTRSRSARPPKPSPEPVES